jgi:hypothetical protein
VAPKRHRARLSPVAGSGRRRTAAADPGREGRRGQLCPGGRARRAAESRLSVRRRDHGGRRRQPAAAGTDRLCAAVPDGRAGPSGLRAGHGGRSRRRGSRPWRRAAGSSSCSCQPRKRSISTCSGAPTRRLSTAFAAALEEQGIDHLDLSLALRDAAGDGVPLYFEVDGHPNERGYAVIADAVIALLRDGEGAAETEHDRGRAPLTVSNSSCHFLKPCRKGEARLTTRPRSDTAAWPPAGQRGMSDRRCLLVSTC